MPNEKCINRRFLWLSECLLLKIRAQPFIRVSQGYNRLNIFKNWGDLVCWMSIKARENMKQCAKANMKYTYAKVSQWRNKWESHSWSVTVLWIVRNVWIQRMYLQAFKMQLCMDWMVTQSKELSFCDGRDQITSPFRH